MKAFLLDVNVLIALVWSGHQHHERAQAWFAQNGKSGWATCPMTQAAFVRVISNPAFSSHAPSLIEGLELLAANLKHPAHQFWVDDLPLQDALSPFTDRLIGHQQITDAYLLGLAVHKKGRLATFDRSVRNLFAREDPRAGVIELLGT